VSGIRQPDDDRIPVAAPRLPRTPRRPRRGVVDATGAGLIVIVVTAAIAALGWWLGRLIGMRWPGALIGGYIGLLLGLTAIRWRYRSL
jgi:uncharacterized YccA/Bax inhibitor family protein